MNPSLGVRNRQDLGKQERAALTLTYGEMQRDSLFKNVTIKLRLFLTFRISQCQM